MQNTQQQKGFGILELIISLAIGLIILAALITTFVAQNKAYSVQEQVTEMLQAARAGMEIMGREIMMAGFDPSGNMQTSDSDSEDDDFVGISLPASNPSSVIEIHADLNGDEDTADANEHITYAFSSGRVTRNAGSGAQTLIENVKSFSVTFWQADGETHATSDGDIRQVRVVLEVQTSRADPSFPDNGGRRTRTLTSYFIPRNLNL